MKNELWSFTKKLISVRFE
ncbi:hypothetical protein QUB33_21080 [Microcoleus sp. B3-A4]